MKNISGVGGTDSVSQIDSDTVRAKRHSSAPPGGLRDDSARFSKPAELFSKLQQLSEQDPEKLKEIAGKIADSLHKAADEAGARGGFLEKLAASFDQVAKTGDLGDLRPKEQPQAPPAGISGRHPRLHHHHHHHGGGNEIGAAIEKAVNMVTDALALPPTAETSTDTSIPAPTPTTSTPTT